MGNFRFAMATKSSTTTRIFAITNVLSSFYLHTTSLSQRFSRTMHSCN